MKILGVLGVLFLSFVVIPWAAITVVDMIRHFWDENNRFD